MLASSFKVINQRFISAQSLANSFSKLTKYCMLLNNTDLVATNAACMSSVNQNVVDETKFEPKPSWIAPVRDEYLLRKKYDLIFSTYDINKDGLFSWDDAEEYIMRLEQIRGDSVEDMPHFRELIRSYLGDMIGDVNRGMDRWQFVDSLCHMRAKNAKRMMERLAKKAVTLWECMDINKDGEVQGEEFVLMFQAMMIDNQNIAKQIFKAIDVNKDGTISKEELRDLYLNYMMNERPDPLSVIYMSGRKTTQRRP